MKNWSSTKLIVFLFFLFHFIVLPKFEFYILFDFIKFYFRSKNRFEDTQKNQFYKEFIFIMNNFISIIDFLDEINMFYSNDVFLFIPMIFIPWIISFIPRKRNLHFFRKKRLKNKKKMIFSGTIQLAWAPRGAHGARFILLFLPDFYFK